MANVTAKVQEANRKYQHKVRKIRSDASRGRITADQERKALAREHRNFMAEMRGIERGQQREIREGMVRKKEQQKDAEKKRQRVFKNKRGGSF